MARIDNPRLLGERLEYHASFDCSRSVVAHWVLLVLGGTCILEDRAMTLERLIEEARTRNGTHAESLRAARERMVNTNKRLAPHFTAQEVTPALLAKTCSL